MRVSSKDMIGAGLVLGTLALLVAHIGPDGHQSAHQSDVADAGSSVTSAARPGSLVAFVDVNVIPMDAERILRRQVVVVEGGFIRQVGPVGAVEPPAGALIVEGEGTTYLVPGLTDAHVHLPEGAEAWLPLFVANGVTTVFNLKGDESHLKLRDRLRAGDLVGPTMYTSGPFTNAPEVKTPGNAVAAVRRQRIRGYDFVKIHGDLSNESYGALMDAAAEEGIAVVGHAPRNLPFSAVLEHRQALVVHAEELIYTHFRALDPSGLSKLGASMALAGTWLTPTLSTFSAITTQWGTTDGLEAGLATESARAMPQSLRDAWRSENPYVGRPAEGRPRIEAMYDFQRPLIRTLYEAGVPMLAGTDTPLPVMAPGFSLHGELAELRGAGLSAYAALEAATSNAGRFIAEHVDRGARFGTVTVGARADLVVVSANPLIDLGRLRSPVGVMVRGRYYDRATLDSMVAAVARKR